MSSEVFYPYLNEICRKYFITGVNLTEFDKASFVPSMKKIEAEIFENLLIFDKVTFKVFGENLPLVVLLKHFGQKRLEELVEQQAIGFTLWTPAIFTMVNNIKGVDPVGAAVHNSSVHADPEQSLESAFQWMKEPPKRRERRALVRKLRDVYKLPEKSLPTDAAAFIKSGFLGGKLKPYGLDPKDKKYDSLSEIEKKKLASCGEDLLEYSYVVSNNLTSISKSEYFNFFHDTARKIEFASTTLKAFSEITRIENFPDLKTLYSQVDKPFERLVSSRKKRTSVKFRNWLFEQASKSEDAKEISLEYINAIAQPSGFFQTWQGKLTKSIVTSSMGAAIGGYAAGQIGMALGATAATIAEPVIGPVVDLVDDYLLDGLTKGWTPRLFIEDLKQLEKQK